MIKDKEVLIHEIQREYPNFKYIDDISSKESLISTFKKAAIDGKSHIISKLLVIVSDDNIKQSIIHHDNDYAFRKASENGHTYVMIKLLENTTDPVKKESMIHAMNDYAFFLAVENGKFKSLEVIATVLLKTSKDPEQIRLMCLNVNPLRTHVESRCYLNNPDLLIEVAKQNNALLEIGFSYEQIEAITDLARATGKFLKIAKNPFSMLPNDITNLILLHSAGVAGKIDDNQIKAVIDVVKEGRTEAMKRVPVPQPTSYVGMLYNACLNLSKTLLTMVGAVEPKMTFQERVTKRGQKLGKIASKLNPDTASIEGKGNQGRST